MKVEFYFGNLMVLSAEMTSPPRECDHVVIDVAGQPRTSTVRLVDWRPDKNFVTVVCDSVNGVS